MQDFNPNMKKNLAKLSLIALLLSACIVTPLQPLASSATTEVGSDSFKLETSNYSFDAKTQANLWDSFNYTSKETNESFLYQPCVYGFCDSTGNRDSIATVTNRVGTQNNNTLTYSRVFPDIDLQYTAFENQLKEDFIISSLAKWPATNLVGNIFLEIGGTVDFGTLHLYVDDIDMTGQNFTTQKALTFQTENQTVFYLPEPTASDSTNHTVSCSYAVQVVENHTWLYVQVPFTWVKTAIFPITVDPTFMLRAQHKGYVTQITWMADIQAADGAYMLLEILLNGVLIDSQYTYGGYVSNIVTLNPRIWLDTDAELPITYNLHSGTLNSFNVIISGFVAVYDVTFTSAPRNGAGFIVVDGVAIVTPRTFSWEQGSSHSASAVSLNVALSSERFFWTHWSDRSLGRQFSFSASGDVSYSAVFDHEWLVTVETRGVENDVLGPVVVINGFSYPQSQLPFSQWLADGSVVTFGFPQTLLATISKQYVWTDSVWLGIHLYPTDFFVVTTAGTLTATYKTQYAAQFTQTGLDDSTAPGPILTVNGVEKTKADLPYSVWVDAGSSVNFVFNSTVSSVLGDRFFVLAASGLGDTVTINNAVTITGVYTIHYIHDGAGDVTITVQANDVTGHALPNTHMTLNGRDYVATNGVFTISGLYVGDQLSGVASWQGIVVNPSVSIMVMGSVTVPISCIAYPYEYGGVTYHVASERSVASNNWDGVRYILTFETDPTACTLVFSAPQVPSYVTGLAYDTADSWNGLNSVFRVELPVDVGEVGFSFANWGSGVYLMLVSVPLVSASWAQQVLTLVFENYATGTLVLQCSTRGQPARVSVSDAKYEATILTVAFSGVHELFIEWSSSGGGGGGGGGSGGGGSLPGGVLDFSSADFGSVAQGTSRPATLTFSFTSSTFQLTHVSFTGIGSEYLRAVNLPETFSGGSGNVMVELNMPRDLPVGSYVVAVILSGMDPNGLQHSASGEAVFVVEPYTGVGLELPDNVLALVGVIAVVVVIIVVVMLFLTRKKR